MTGERLSVFGRAASCRRRAGEGLRWPRFPAPLTTKRTRMSSEGHERAQVTTASDAVTRPSVRTAAQR